MSHLFRGLLVVAIVLAAIAGKRYFFPSDMDLIKGRLSSLGELLSKEKTESRLNTISKIGDALEFFNYPLTVRFDIEGITEKSYSVSNANEVKELVGSLKFRYPWLTVEFQDIEIDLEENEAEVRSTVRLDFEASTQERVYDLYEIQTLWIKSDGTWKIGDTSIEFLNIEES